MSTPQQQQRRRRRQLWGKQVSKQAINQSTETTTTTTTSTQGRRIEEGTAARRGEAIARSTARASLANPATVFTFKREYFFRIGNSLSLSLRRKMRDTCSVVARGITVGGDDDGVWLGDKLRKDKGCSTRNGQRRSRLRHVVCVCLCVCVGKWRL